MQRVKSHAKISGVVRIQLEGGEFFDVPHMISHEFPVDTDVKISVSSGDSTSCDESTLELNAIVVLSDHEFQLSSAGGYLVCLRKNRASFAEDTSILIEVNKV